MTSKSYINEKYIVYFEDEKQYTRANNNSTLKDILITTSYTMYPEKE